MGVWLGSDVEGENVVVSWMWRRDEGEGEEGYANEEEVGGRSLAIDRHRR